ncbi:MAG: VWA domain-containing protein [Saprospiraceae bacterium]|nr:VWA domain-containing protein [Saprospiraceae bacterium]
MFIKFFYSLRSQGIPVSLHEYLALMEALRKGLCDNDIDAFYALSKSLFVKQEGHLDRFDQVFGAHFKGIEMIPDDVFDAEVPPDWLMSDLWNELSDEEKAAIEAMGGLDALMDRFRELLDEQDEAHEGGNKWIGKGGTSPFGAGGYNPEGFRLGGPGRHRRAIKVWEKRAFKNLDDRVELHTRNIKLILKRLRILTREGMPTELDLDNTIRKTSENAGMLDISLQAKKKNNVKVLMLMDVGGSMDDHIHLCEQLFSAARWEFKHLEFFYFHNCLYESVWTDNKRRFRERIPTLSLLHKYSSDYKLIFVGDAAMSPYEIFYRGGSVEHFNDEPGILWLRRMKEYFKQMVWINPLPEYEWEFFESVRTLREYTDNRMFPMTVEGLTNAMKALKNSKIRYENKTWEE